MKVYTYSEARQKLSSVLDKAESTGKILIRRQDEYLACRFRLV